MLVALLISGCGGSSDSGGGEAEDQEQQQVSSGNPEDGEVKFNEVCITCHGPGGVGVDGLGKPFTTSEFIKSNNDSDLLAFVKTGRPIGDPLNTTGVDMPPKGGNPALNDEQILDIIAYIRTLQQ